MVDERDFSKPGAVDRDPLTESWKPSGSVFDPFIDMVKAVGLCFQRLFEALFVDEYEAAQDWTAAGNEASARVMDGAYVAEAPSFTPFRRMPSVAKIRCYYGVVAKSLGIKPRIVKAMTASELRSWFCSLNAEDQQAVLAHRMKRPAKKAPARKKSSRTKSSAKKKAKRKARS